MNKRVDTFEKYCDLFKDAGRAIARGEISPNYLFHYASSSLRIQRYVPNAKLFVMLRVPMERAFSDDLMHLRDVINGGQPIPLTEQARPKTATSFTIRKGFYYEPLKVFMDTFGAERISVFLYDDLCRNPVGMMQDLYRFLEVDDTFQPDTSKRYQQAKVPKSSTVNALLNSHNPVRQTVASMLKLIMPESVRQRVRSTLIGWNSQTKEAVALSPNNRHVLADRYREDVQKLQDLIHRDLSHWFN